MSESSETRAVADVTFVGPIRPTLWQAFKLWRHGATLRVSLKGATAEAAAAVSLRDVRVTLEFPYCEEADR